MAYCNQYRPFRPSLRWQSYLEASFLSILLAMTGHSAASTSSASEINLEATPEQTFQLALESQADRQYTAMLAQLREAARAGSVNAQEMLGLVLLSGKTVYGDAILADRCEAVMWIQLAAAQGSQVGRYQLNFLNRLRQSPSAKGHCPIER